MIEEAGSGRRPGRVVALALVVATVALTTALWAPAGPSLAQAAGVSGEAYGYFTSVGLFGGAPRPVGPAPRVVLPAAGSEAPLTASAPDGGSAVFGPAHIFGGRQPQDVAAPGPSGPITVSTRGTPGAGGSVTSTAEIVRFPTPVPVTCDGQPPETKNCGAPGGFGPTVPAEGDELHSTCTANEQGATGSTRFVNAVLTTSTEASGAPKDREPIPDDPPPNYTREGEITNVGGKFKIILNEQIVDPDGSITVNAVHLFLQGGVAIGEQVLGHVRCSMRPAEASPTTSVAGPAASTPTTAPAGPPAPPPASGGGGTEGDPVPVLVAAAALAAGLGILWLWTHRRQPDDTEPAADEGP